MFDLAPLINADVACSLKNAELMEINNRSAYYNLRLSEADIIKLLSERNDALRNTERVEFGTDTLGAIIETFYDSPYINQFEYADVLIEIQLIFYHLKNETEETFSDEELLGLMKELFNGGCAGSAELLKGAGAEYIIGMARQRRRISENIYGSETMTPVAYSACGNSLDASYTEEEALKALSNLTKLLEELSIGYAKNRSFSIKASAAAAIVRSVLFAAKVAGEREIFNMEKLKAAYYNGVEIIGGMTRDALRLFGEVKRSVILTDFKPYNSSIKGVARFFEDYDPRYGAAEIPAKFNYFPLFYDERTEGILFLNSYLSALLLENRFCRLFDKCDVTRLINARLRRAALSVDWMLSGMNIFELVAANSVLATAIGKLPSEILMTAQDKNVIARGQEAGFVLQLRDAAYSASRYFNLDEALENYLIRFVDERLAPKAAGSAEAVTAGDLALYADAKRGEYY